MTAFKDEKIVELSNSIIKHITSEEKLEQQLSQAKELLQESLNGQTTEEIIIKIQEFLNKNK